MRVAASSLPAISLVILSIYPFSIGAYLYGTPLAYADVSGTWDLKVQTSGRTATPTIILVQEGEKLTGTYRGRMGESKLEGTIKGVEITFTVNLKFQDQNLKIVYSGTVDNDSMKGTAQFGDRGAGEWTANKRPN